MHFVNVTVQNQKHLFSKPTKQLNLLKPKNNNQSNNRIRSNRKRVISEHASGKNGSKTQQKSQPSPRTLLSQSCWKFRNFPFAISLRGRNILYNSTDFSKRTMLIFFFYLYVDAISVTIPKARTRKLSKRNILGRTMVIPWKENHPFIR